MTAFYTQLDKLKHAHPALYAGVEAGTMNILNHTAPESVFAFTRTKGNDQLLVMLNLSRKPAQFKFDQPLTASYADAFTGETVKPVAPFTLKAGEYRVWVRK